MFILIHSPSHTYREVIAINQDKMGKQGRLIASSITKHSGQRKSPEVTNMVFARPLDGGDLAVAMLNTGHFSGPHNITVSFKDVSVLFLLRRY